MIFVGCRFSENEARRDDWRNVESVWDAISCS